MAMKFDKLRHDEQLSPGQIKRLKALMLLQERWLLIVVQALMDGPLGFNELTREAACVINNTTLSQRLDLLEQCGIVNRTVQSSVPPRTSYELTASGRALKTVFDAIGKWADKHMPDDFCPSTSSVEHAGESTQQHEES
jgi:DNA-binding HxlR family transcriptional regulator